MKTNAARRLATLVLGLLGAAAQAAPAADCGPYRVGLKSYPLVYERAPGGGYRGLDKDFFALLAERSGCRFELELESQPRIWARLPGLGALHSAGAQQSGGAELARAGGGR
jgi:ABC-type amino acid transport substrate-binding protein